MQCRLYSFSPSWLVWRGIVTVVKPTAEPQKVKKVQIKKLLIANRGEIACRIIRTAKQLNIHTVAVYSDADCQAMHVLKADSAYNIGLPPSKDSYLRSDKILSVAHKAGADAIHPGYGFLSENAEFAEECQKDGIIFVGPSASAIRDMGIKSTSKAIMSAAGVPIIEGYHGEDQSDTRLVDEAHRIGFPIMIKAVRGGGGKGMRIAMSSDEFLFALGSARREALKSFGDDTVLLERYISSPRHVEVQVFADHYGNCVHLFERDCSVQRRHQKVIEEAPAPGLPEEVRQGLGAAGVQAAKAVGYVGAGTVEFILDPATLGYHFMEMNTRLQVEHPITEMITGTDLVEWQIKVASGERLPLTQDQLSINGHAFEARIYAENPEAAFMPGAGSLLHLTTPTPQPDVRIETGVQQGDEVSVHYDPMIAKLVVWSEDRKSALEKLSKNLLEYQVVGLDTNLQLLRRLTLECDFQEGLVHTGFIEQHIESLLADFPLPNTTIIQAAVGIILHEKLVSENVALRSSNPHNPFTKLSGFRLNHIYKRNIELRHKEKEYKLDVVYERDGSFTVKADESTQPVNVSAKLCRNPAGLRLTSQLGGQVKHIQFVLQDPYTIHLFSEYGAYKLSLPCHDGGLGGEGTVQSSVVSSPMPGVVEKLLVQPGDKVQTDDSLLVIIAMKMEHVIKSPRNGVVERFLVQAGENVNKNVPLIQWQE